MKTQHEATIQFSGYPLSIVETNKNTREIELKVVKHLSFQVANQKNSVADDPKNWDVDWFNSYE